MTLNNTFNISNKNIKKIHLIGICGVSMSAIAIMLKKAGFTITGSDKMNNEKTIQTLNDHGIDVYVGSNAELVKDADIVVYTSAINQHDSEFVRAKSLNIPVYERAVFLGMLLKEYSKTICISGTHGKTTTTSMTASIFIDANLNPNVQIGGHLKKLNNLNYAIADSDYFILESCEYVDSFLNFPHHCATILNIEEDHLDYFSGIEEIKTSFEKFILMSSNNGNLVINYDDIHCMSIYEKIKSKLKEKNITTYTFSLGEVEADICATNIRCNVKGFYSFDITSPKDGKIYSFYLTVPGIHNVYDALGAITTAYAYNIDFKIMQKSLSEFSGAGRRFEFKKKLKDNILVYDDYAHHPTEIKATLNAAKQKENARVISIFQPHTYSRTKELLDDFSTSFSDSDICIITDIYAARETNIFNISSKDLVDLLIKNNVNAIYIETFEEIVKYLKKNMEENDLILTMGAGSITKLGDMIEI